MAYKIYKVAKTVKFPNTKRDTVVRVDKSMHVHLFNDLNIFRRY